MADIIQSLSICCPSANGKCINHCKTCTARQHTNPYQNKFDGTHTECFDYWQDVKKRMIYAQSKGCTTVMLTGSNEPQQNRRWLESLYLVMQSLPQSFVNIEIQTTGAFLDHDYLKFLKRFGVTTVAVSAFNIYGDPESVSINREIEENADIKLNIESLCKDIIDLGMNLRICLNITNYISHDIKMKENYPSDNLDFIRITNDILKQCAKLGADQVTFRKMWSTGTGPEADWIANNCYYSNKLIDAINVCIKENGTIINKLPYGAVRYDYDGFSIVIDIDSMAKDEDNMAIKYYIIRENGKMYSSWDSKASIVF